MLAWGIELYCSAKHLHVELNVAFVHTTVLHYVQHARALAHLHRRSVL